MSKLDKHDGHIRTTKVRHILEEQNYICTICGDKIDDNRGDKGDCWSVDHIVPQAVFKWSTFDDVIDIMNDENNLLIVHSKCNTNKGEKIPKVHYTDTLHLSRDVSSRKIAYRKSVEGYIQDFIRLKTEVIEKQNNRCRLCNKLIPSVSTCSLRRIDKSQDMVKSNACVVCLKCSYKVERVRKHNYGILK